MISRSRWWSTEVQNAILKDIELDEFKKRLEALESTQGQPGGAPVYTPVFEGIEWDP